MKEINLTNETFKAEVLESDKPVLVDFWATWCGPCQMLSPVIAEIAEEHPEIKVCKVNVDSEMELASQFNVMSIPFVAVFKNGNLTASSVGYQPKENILNLLKYTEKDEKKYFLFNFFVTFLFLFRLFSIHNMKYKIETSSRRGNLLLLLGCLFFFASCF